VIQNLDFSYYLLESEIILKQLYDRLFKKHTSFNQLKSYLVHDELQQNLVKQVFRSRPTIKKQT
jgi:hypothetical protein